MRIYLDSAVVIYDVEQVSPYSELLDSRLSAGDLVIVTSDLTRLECRVKPLRDANAALLEDFDDYFEGIVEVMVPLSREVVDLATGARAQYGFKAPDSLHLGAAIWSECDVFLTNDHRLDRFRELSIEVVKPRGIAIARCTERGGRVVSGPRSMGSYGRCCVIQDSAGAVAALIQPPDR